MTASTTIYGTFRPKIPKLGGIRHVVFPSVAVSDSPDVKGLQYTDTAGVKRNRCDTFGGIGISDIKGANMSWPHDKRVQDEHGHGDHGGLVAAAEPALHHRKAGPHDAPEPRRGAKHGLGARVENGPPGAGVGHLPRQRAPCLQA